MRKNRIARIEEISGASEPEITPAEDKLNRQSVVDTLMLVVEKFQNLSAVPVAENFDELFAQLKNGVKRQPVIINRADGKRVKVADGITTIISGGETRIDGKNDTGKDSQSNTVFSDSELLMLRELEK